MLSTNNKVTDGFDERYGVDMSFYGLIDVNYGVSEKSDSRIIVSPFSFPRAGSYYFADGIRSSGGSNGLYWTSQDLDSMSAYYMRFNSGALNPKYHDDKRYGRSVRCGGEFLGFVGSFMGDPLRECL